MFTQDNWGTFTTHNLKNLSNFKIESNISHVVLGSKKELKLSEQPKIIEEKPEIKFTEKNNQKEPVVAEQPKFIQKPKNEYEDFDKTIMHCALAKMEEKKDSLYGDVAVKVKFIEKFTFESIVLSLNDFTLIFWTMLDKLTIGSILYPQDDSKRWWEIKEIESVPGGYKVICVFTRNTPSF